MFDVSESRSDDRQAADRFSGPDYLEVLGWLHEWLRPAVYLEIGVLYGESLRLAMPPTLAIGVDPAPLADHPWRTETRIHPMTSREFFLRGSVPQISLAFLDGAHLFEDALDDFRNVEHHAAKGAVVALHDTIPLDERTAARERVTDFHTGDVWKMLAYYTHYRPGLEVVTVSAAPTGLTLVRGLSAPPRHDENDVARIAALPFAARADHLVSIPNSREAVHAWLLRQ